MQILPNFSLRYAAIANEKRRSYKQPLKIIITPSFSQEKCCQTILSYRTKEQSLKHLTMFPYAVSWHNKRVSWQPYCTNRYNKDIFERDGISDIPTIFRSEKVQKIFQQQENTRGEIGNWEESRRWKILITLSLINAVEIKLYLRIILLKNLTIHICKNAVKFNFFTDNWKESLF